MIKTVSPAGWDFDGPAARLVKVSTRGLRGNDRADFVKYASHAFLDVLDNLKHAADEEPVHLLSHGATEAYGPNRNGDGFKEATCRRYHRTFEKFARWYRNHKNKDPRLSYGIIKASAYNETMRRVELLTFLNREKSAAERNGGLVADKELEKLAKGQDLAVSMACRVPFDECSWCGNRARTREEYCKEGSCKAGGCTDNLTRLVKVGSDVHHLHVDNPDPTWFDISNVFRPADRIAYGSKADWLTKAAADGWDGVYGRRAAEDMGLLAPLAVVLHQDRCGPGGLDGQLLQQVKLAHGLDMLQRRPQLHPGREARRAFDPRVQGGADLGPLGQPGTVKCADGLATLADEKVILPLRDFARLAGQAPLAKAAAAAMGGVYGRMIADGSLEGRLADNPYAVSEKVSPAGQRRSWACQAYDGLSLDKEAVDRRAQLSVLRGYRAPDLETGLVMSKAAADGGAEGLARDYACYKVAALARIAGFDPQFELTATLAVTQDGAV